MNPGDADTAARLAAWLAAHMERHRLTAGDVAGELAVSTETVRGWLSAAGRPTPVEAGEFAHLDTPAKLGAWLRARIVDSGRSVREIAEDTESVSTSTVYNWLRGEHLPPPPTGEEPDRFDMVLSHPALGLDLRRRVRLDEVRRRLTGASLRLAAEPAADWPARALPAGNRTFTGRGDEHRRLDRLLTQHARGTAVVISALTGMGGAGKTALAVHWARTQPVRATFTDGSLYINLNGYAEAPPLTVDTALRKLLQQFGIDARQMPADTDALAAFYQEALAGRRLLIVLDNAHAEPQVRPLLPGDPGCLAVVTSRNRLQGLGVTHGPVAHVRLDVLSAREAASLLRKLLGALVVKSTSDEDLDALADACGHLPLALQIAAANYLTHAHATGVSIREYADSLHGRRLDALAVGPTDPTTAVSAVLDHSYRHLSPDARRAYRFLGLHPGPDWTLKVAASLLAEPADLVRSLMADLVQANLVSEHRPGRYTFHDLLRDHAAALTARLDAETERREAKQRMLAHYVHTAQTAAFLVDPGITEGAIPLGAPAPSVDPEALPDHEAAMTWFETEHPAMAAVAAQAPEDCDVYIWHTARTLSPFLVSQGHWLDEIAVQRGGLAAAERLGEPAAQAYSYRTLARTHTRLGHLPESRSHLMRALELSARAGDLVGQASTRHSLGHLANVQGQFNDALGHSREALPLYRAAGNHRGEAQALNAIGWYHALLGELDEALEYCERALELCLELDYRNGEAAATDSLGYIHHRRGDRDQALFHYQRARELHQALGDRYNEADTLSHLGDLHASLGAHGAALEAWRQALTILEELQHSDAECIRALIDELPREAPSD
ncbi:ATP-binding protein [Glycomyces harbinensis]|uniref:Tetratricopeptide (TPR) repeat n=1 Tax=Glycomyces harbinensis TaxID=58114 RepID=A0A1G6XDY7_9ACTN|nr:tetratricopeptide repeat protein [Glycomyces harbinensis]SDD75456.1 Tetratricopeptide (TPR) repeat [Glycomyces harbinensis]